MCRSCGKERVLIARKDSRRVCGPCAGQSDPYACPRCGNPRSYMVRGLCDRCALHDHLDTIFGPLPAAVADQYRRMRTALAACEQPRTALNWIRNAHSARLLADLLAAGQPLTHGVLDAMAQGGGRGGAQSVDYLRGALVPYQALPERDAFAARIERHLTRVTQRSPEHALLLHSYVRWSLLPRARRAAQLPAGCKHRIHWAYTRINQAAAFLTP